jgi:hypothetical protein
MSATDVLTRFGTFALLRFVLALLVFVFLHLARLPVLLLAVVLEGAMSRMDKAITSAVSRDVEKESVAGEGIR